MGLRKAKKEAVVGTVKIELSDEARQALVQLENDLQVITEFMSDVVANGQRILAALQGQVIAATGGDSSLYETLSEPIPGGRSGQRGVGVRAFIEPEPLVMPGVAPEAVLPSDPVEDLHRQRSSPFNRRPRHEQEAWMIKYMSEHPGWHHAHVIAREFSGDEREFRYLKSAISRTLKELFDSGQAERTEATERGSLYRYRLSA